MPASAPGVNMPALYTEMRALRARTAAGAEAPRLLAATTVSVPQTKAELAIFNNTEMAIMTNDVQRDARIARALQIRLDQILQEMHSCERLCQQAYEFADSKLDEFDELAETRYLLTRCLWKVEQRRFEAIDRQNREEVAA